jgi:hypothetical protein
MHALQQTRGRRFFGEGFRPRVEALEGRLCLSVTVSTVEFHGETALKIVGDGSANTVTITDQGNGTVEVNDGTTTTTENNISAIKFYGRNGTDTVNYTLAGALASDQKLYIDLGSGGDGAANLDLTAGLNADFDAYVEGSRHDDTMSALLGPMVNSHSKVKFEGGSGDDDLSVTGAAAATLDAGSQLRLYLDGDSGDDSITTDLAGSIAGRLSLKVDGGRGVDTILSDIDVSTASTGRINAKVEGGRGIDDVTLNINGDDSALAALDAAIRDIGGDDNVTSTANVEVITEFPHFGRGRFGAFGESDCDS